MAKNNNLTDFVTDIANHFRGKLGLPSTSKINPQNFSDYVDAMPHLVDISEQCPDLVVNLDLTNPATTIAIEDNFPWKTLSDGSNFLPVVVYRAVLSYQFSEVIEDETAGGAMGIQTAFGNREPMVVFNINNGDTDLHTMTYWWGDVVRTPTLSMYPADIFIDFNPDSPAMKKCTASIVVTPYIVKIGDRVLSLQTCKGEA